MEPMAQLAGALAFAMVGVAAGIATGIVPGLHVNNLALMILSMAGAVACIILAIFPSASAFDVALLTASLVASIAVTHTFVNCIPATFLGAPDESTSLGALPAHRMTLEGRGYEAVELSAIGSLGGLLLSFTLIIPAYVVLGPPLGGYERFVSASIAMILIVIVAMLLLDEGGKPGRSMEALHGIIIVGGSEPHVAMSSLAKGSRAKIRGRVTRSCGPLDFWLRDDTGEVHVRLDFGLAPAPGATVSVAGRVVGDSAPSGGLARMARALSVFVISGAIGAVLLVPEGVAYLLPVPLMADEGAVLLLPLFSGLFGLPMLIESMKGRDRIPSQATRSSPKLSALRRLRGSLSGTVGGCMTGWLPGASSSVAAAMTAQISGANGVGSADSEEFIVSVSAVSTANTVFNVLALFVLFRARSGAMKAVQSILGTNVQIWSFMDQVPWAFVCIISVVLASGVAAFALTLAVGKRAAKLLPRVRYRPMAAGVCCFVVSMSFIFGGVLGLVILACSYCIGTLPSRFGVRRVHLMGCIILPTLWFFLSA
jgi:putative membrane protein